MSNQTKNHQTKNKLFVRTKRNSMHHSASYQFTYSSRQKPELGERHEHYRLTHFAEGILRTGKNIKTDCLCLEKEAVWAADGESGLAPIFSPQRGRIIHCWPIERRCNHSDVPRKTMRRSIKVLKRCRRAKVMCVRQMGANLGSALRTQDGRAAPTQCLHAPRAV